MAGSGKQVTEERYSQIKIVVDSLPERKSGNKLVFEALGVSPSTALLIRRSKDWSDYKQILQVKYERRSDRIASKTQGNISPVIIEKTTNQFVTLNTIESKVEEILAVVNRIKPKFLEKE